MRDDFEGNNFSHGVYLPCVYRAITLCIRLWLRVGIFGFVPGTFGIQDAAASHH